MLDDRAGQQVSIPAEAEFARRGPAHGVADEGDRWRSRTSPPAGGPTW